MSGRQTSGDNKGYERGAKGIDGKEGENYAKAGIDRAAQEKMYGRNWQGNSAWNGK